MTERKSPLEEALQFEQEGYEFFTSASKKSGDPMTKKIYDYLAQMEMRHIEDIHRIAAILKEQGKFPEKATLSGRTERSKVFTDAAKNLKKEKVLPKEEVTALREGLEFEYRGREMYEKFSEEASDPNEKHFYELLAGEEQKHFDIIYEYLEFFEEKGLRMQE